MLGFGDIKKDKVFVFRKELGYVSVSYGGGYILVLRILRWFLMM